MADLNEVFLLCVFYSGVVLSALMLPKPAPQPADPERPDPEAPPRF